MFGHKTGRMRCLMGSRQTLDELRTEFGRNRFLAMPIAGTLGWTAAGVLGAFLPVGPAALALFIIGGAILWLGVCSAA